jgi:hypothetical protein
VDVDRTDEIRDMLAAMKYVVTTMDCIPESPRNGIILLLQAVIDKLPTV